jgi:hypothetical protein
MKKFKDELSIRSTNGLARCFGRQAFDTPEVIAQAGAKRLRFAVGLGAKSIKEIAFVLNRYGYIDDIDNGLMFNSLSNRFYAAPMKKLVLLMFVFLALSGCAVPKYNYSPLTTDISEPPLIAAPVYLEVDIVDCQYEKSLDGQAIIGAIPRVVLSAVDGNGIPVTNVKICGQWFDYDIPANSYYCRQTDSNGQIFFAYRARFDNSYDVATWHASMVDLSAFDIYFKVLDMIKPGYEFVDSYGPITVLNRRPCRYF